MTLNNGVEIPILEFGVYQMSDAEGHEAVREALATGFRLVEAPASYHNEAAVGRVIQESGIRREELFITTKL